MKHDMKSYTVESHTSFNAVGEISGYLVRPGMFETNGATPLPVGVNFTVHTSGGTSCELCCSTGERKNRMRCCRFRMNTGSGMYIP